MTVLLRSPFVDCNSPDWASGWGQDRYGYFAEFSIRTGPMYWEIVTQRMRWIPAGTFLMGSPESEAERSDNEVQHEVTISQGFWLADTTCQQELWEAVMANNPSQFKGLQHPVENVNYHDALEFCERIAELVPGLRLQLPTESQWEYACRAGTTTAFSYGETVSTDDVNYDGNYPMPNSPPGEYRQTTIDCKMLHPNDWGLYQMHGNVREWCSDWYGPYDREATVDPNGPPTGSSRVFRGGCWIVDARLARSAYRFRYAPGLRSSALGFRCLSSVKPGAEQVRAARSEPRDEAAE
ncbi:formylglycine-generating enzyme family protein [Rhodopirellula baltica]|nr:formylglycine-generating enzyme family protein [Rhodopirellula baltica]